MSEQALAAASLPAKIFFSGKVAAPLALGWSAKASPCK